MQIAGFFAGLQSSRQSRFFSQSECVSAFLKSMHVLSTVCARLEYVEPIQFKAHSSLYLFNIFLLFLSFYLTYLQACNLSIIIHMSSCFQDSSWCTPGPELATGNQSIRGSVQVSDHPAEQRLRTDQNRWPKK